MKRFILIFLGIIGFVIMASLMFIYLSEINLYRIACVMLLGLLAISFFYLYRFANIILVFEDDLSTTLETLKECEESLDNILSLRLFFDSEHVRPVVETAKEEVGLCRLKVRQMAQRFVERSKQQYIVYEEPIQIEQIRNQPGAIDDQLMTNRIRGFRQELGDDEDVYFMTPEEMEAARRARKL